MSFQLLEKYHHENDEYLNQAQKNSNKVFKTDITYLDYLNSVVMEKTSGIRNVKLRRELCIKNMVKIRIDRAYPADADDIVKIIDVKTSEFYNKYLSRLIGTSY